eukprot:COSAG02_NODE_664_length_18739_cov_11.071567_5_plen_60_part_00
MPPRHIPPIIPLNLRPWYQRPMLASVRLMWTCMGSRGPASTMKKGESMHHGRLPATVHG